MAKADVTDEVQVLLLEPGFATPGLVEVGIAAVDQHVPGLQKRRELVDHGVGGIAGVDHDQHAPRPLECADELLRGLGRDERTLLAELGGGFRGPGGRPVVQGHDVSMAGKVAGQVAAHHAEPGDAYLR